MQIIFTYFRIFKSSILQYKVSNIVDILCNINLKDLNIFTIEYLLLNVVHSQLELLMCNLFFVYLCVWLDWTYTVV
jgi:hypothetical protein